MLYGKNMQFLSLLNTAIIPHFGQTFDVEVGWLGEIVKWIISGVGIVGLGVVIFSLILKFVVLPLDVYQRITMRKQNQQMEANKERMEKLQKQYANDKEKYNQKVMEMYKENGMSMFSSCLPMILSMVITTILSTVKLVCTLIYQTLLAEFLTLWNNIPILMKKQLKN